MSVWPTTLSFRVGSCFSSFAISSSDGFDSGFTTDSFVSKVMP
jgi:hypothetical protein